MLNHTPLDDKQSTEQQLPQIAQAKKEWEATVDVLPQLMCLLDESGQILRANRTVEHWNLATIYDVIGKSIHEILHPNCNENDCPFDALWEVAQGHLSQQEPYSVEVTDSIRDCVYDVQFRPIKPDITDTKNRFASVMLTDITERVRLQGELQNYVEQSAILRTIDSELTKTLDVQHVMQIGLNAICNVNYAQAAALVLLDETQNITDYKAIDYIEEEIKQLIPQDIAENGAIKHTTSYYKIVSNENSMMRLPLVSANQIIGLIYLEFDETHSYDAQLMQFNDSIKSRITSALVNAQLYEISRDHVSELQALNAEISTLEQLKTDMIRLASHDLRNPLASIQLSIDIMARYDKDNTTDLQKRHHTSIRKSIVTMKTIINDILSLERINLIRKQQLSTVDLVPITQRVFENFKSQAQDKALNYQLYDASMPMLVKGDNALIQEVMSNFISNALKYTLDGGDVAIYLEFDGEHAAFKVVDTGIGIPLEEQSQIFEPFFRANNATSKDIDGVGLGLNVTTNIIQLMKGQLIFESELDKGSTFGFILPLSKLDVDTMS